MINSQYWHVGMCCVSNLIMMMVVAVVLVLVVVMVMMVVVMIRQLQCFYVQPLRCCATWASRREGDDLAMRSTGPDGITWAVSSRAVGTVQDNVAIILQLQLAVWSFSVRSAVPDRLAALFVHNEVAVGLHFESRACVAVRACSRMR